MRNGQPLIVADGGIPAVETHFEGLGRLRLLSADAIDRVALKDADVLIVRSVTTIDASLLDGTSVRFVGTATSGEDHVDRPYLRLNRIAFAHARGANAESVGDYVIAALLREAARRGTTLRGRTVGIVGCGHVGGRLARRLPALGMELLLCDPPKDRRARREGRPSPFVDLGRILPASDVVTLHTPLATHGRDATHHLLGRQALGAMRPDAWLVNTARGGVIDEAALLERWRSDGSAALVLDVWEGEPTPDPLVVDRAHVATAHIAGYADDAKWEATRRMARSVSRFLGRSWQAPLSAGADRVPLDPPNGITEPDAWLDALVRRMYPLDRDDEALRTVVAGPEIERGRRFESLRRNYPGRRHFSAHVIDEAAVPPALHEAVFNGLGVLRA